MHCEKKIFLEVCQKHQMDSASRNCFPLLFHAIDTNNTKYQNSCAPKMHCKKKYSLKFVITIKCLQPVETFFHF